MTSADSKIDEKKDFFGAPNKDENPASEATSVTGIDDIDAENGEQVDVTEEVPPRDISGWKWALVVFSILSSTFLFALDSTIVADVQPTIVTHFNAVSKLSWLSVAFLIGAAATNLVWGKVFGQFNAKWMYILCVILFEVGSAICGAAPTINALIVGRAICGVGGSGMYVGVMTLLAATTTMHERPMYAGGTGLTWGDWRFAFYINLFIGAVCAPVYLFMLPNKDPRPGVSFMDRAREMDYLGGLLIIGAFISGVMAMSFGGVTYPWNSGKIIGLFCCSGVLFILLGLQQSPTIIILFAMAAAGGTAVFIPIYMIPIYFQFTRAVITNGALLSAYGLYMPWHTVEGIFVVIGGALMYTVDMNSSVSAIYGYTVFLGLGTGFYAQASFSVAQAVVEPELIPLAVGFITCAQISGVTIALAIANSVFLNKSQTAIEGILPNVPLSEIQAAIAGAGSAFVTSLSDALKLEVLEAIVSAMSKTYILVITAGALTTVLSFAMRRERLFIAAGAA
ncbi:MFS general substrate transporter [Acephala macrosclerotiorum]|nr:MFS general substrate transporter [Acephala macrosclerotiorum]